MLTKNEKKLLLSFLNNLRDNYGNAGCNDFRLANTLANKKMLCKAIKKVYSKKNAKVEIKSLMEEKGETIMTFDTLLLGYLIERIEEGKV